MRKAEALRPATFVVVQQGRRRQLAYKSGITRETENVFNGQDIAGDAFEFNGEKMANYKASPLIKEFRKKILKVNY